MAVKTNPAFAWDRGPWHVATFTIEGEVANLHIRQGLLDEVPDIVSRALSMRSDGAGTMRLRPLADDEPMEGFVMVAPRKTTSGQYVRVRPARPADRRAS